MRTAAPAILALAMGWATPAAAWTNAVWYDTAAEQGGGGGLWYTGTAVDRGLDCAACHQPDDGPRPRLSIASDPPELADGRFVPGATYLLTFVLEAETRGLDLACSRAGDESCNDNGFAARVVTTAGTPAGMWCGGAGAAVDCEATPPGHGDDVWVAGDRRAVASTGATAGSTRWSARWTAPERADELSLVVVAIDGNGGDGTFSRAPHDLTGDGFAKVTLRVRAAPELGCATSGSPFDGGAVGILLVLLALWRTGAGRRRAWIPLAAIALGAAAQLACAPGRYPQPVQHEGAFETEVLPVLSGRCRGAGCHEGPHAAARLDVSSIEALTLRADALVPWGPYADSMLVLKVSPPSDEVAIGHPAFSFAPGDPDLERLRAWTRAGAPPIMRRSVLDGVVLAAAEVPPYVPLPVDEDVLAAFAPVESWLVERCASGLCHQWAGGRLLLRAGSEAVAEQTRQNYLTVHELVEPGAPPEFSQLLRKIVSPVAGGLPHAGGADYPTFAALEESAPELWRFVRDDAGPPSDREPSAEERRFVDDVHPVLVRRGCLFENCHGPAVPSALRLRPGVGGQFSPADLAENYRACRAQLAPAARPEVGRLLAKPLDLPAGGATHAALASFATTDDPDYQTLLDWARAEADAAARAAGTDLGTIEGIVTLQVAADDVDASEDPDLVLGGDLWLAAATLEEDGTLWLGGAPENLTADAHPDGPADVREPAVRPDGLVVAFAMRTEADGAFDLWEVELAGRTLRRLTDDAGTRVDGCRIDNRAPAYAPDGTIVFVSTRACEGTTTPGELASQLYRLSPGRPEVQRLTWALDGVAGATVRAFDSTVIHPRRFADGRASLFEVSLDGTAQHSDHAGNRLDVGVVSRPRVGPDGRTTLAIARAEGAFGGTPLVFDRGLGVPSADPFRPASLLVLDESRAFGALEALPDGALLAVVEGSDGRFVLARIAPGWAAGTVALEVLEDRPGITILDAVPLWIRSAPLEDAPPVEAPIEPGTIEHLGFAVTDALLPGNDPPEGAPAQRALRIRLVQIDPPPVGWAPSGPGGPAARVLLEAPLEPDGSVSMRVPLGVPFRVQALDGRGRALRERRWSEWAPPDSAPGGGLRQDVPRRFFEGMCGPCHGALSGRARDVVVVDTLTGASRALANAPGRTPIEPTAPRGAAWVEDLAPTLAEQCASAACHGGGAAPDLGGEPAAALAALLDARTAGDEPWLARGMLSTAAPLVALLEGQPAGGVASDVHAAILEADVVDLWALWIDLGQPWSRTP